MNPGYISAISALAGSSIGAMASVGTAWLTQKYQDRSQRLIQESARREKIFGDFLEGVSKQYGEALATDVSSPAALVDLYAVMGKLRLFASPETLAAAERLLRVIAATYQSPPADLSHADLSHDNIHDLVREFTECCRADLTHAAILRGADKSGKDRARVRALGAWSRPEGRHDQSGKGVSSRPEARNARRSLTRSACRRRRDRVG